MSAPAPLPAAAPVFPDSDGQPMAENTRQWEAIATLKGNVEAITDAFVAGDHLIYTDPTDPGVRYAPDVYAAFGRPRGHRGSYKLWEEAGVFPQVIFEVLGPSNTPAEMADKRDWYFARGADEYYEFDPEAGTWVGFERDPAGGPPREVPDMDGHVSPRLGMRFGFRPLELLAFRPDGSRFLSYEELNDGYARERLRRAAAEEQQAAAERRRRDAEQRQRDAEQRQRDAEQRQVDAEQRQMDAEQRQVDAEQRQVDAEQRQMDAERQRDAERDRAAVLAAKLRALGLDPDAP